jgi:hypothetical protein
MKNLMKQALGAVALSAMSLSMIGTDGAVAKPKSDKIKVNPPTAAEVETGQLLIKDRPGRPSAARKNKTGWIIPTIAVAAALGAVLASGNNDDNPTSP